MAMEYPAFSRHDWSDVMPAAHFLQEAFRETADWTGDELLELAAATSELRDLAAMEEIYGMDDRRSLRAAEIWCREVEDLKQVIQWRWLDEAVAYDKDFEDFP